MGNHNKGLVTIKTLAEYTGHSVGTVSSVLTNQHEKRRISLETVHRIRTAAQKLGYVPNMAARRLRSQTSQVQQAILVVITAYESPITLASYALHSLQHVIDRETQPTISYSMTIEMFHADHLSELPGLTSTSRFSGAIITNTTAKDDEFLNAAFIPYPVVVINRDLYGYATVSEHPETGREAAQELLALDRRNLGILHPAILTQSTLNRVNSFKRAVAESTGKAAKVIISEDLTETSSFHAMQKFMSKREKLDGLYCVSDTLALGAYHAIKRKRKIPEQVAVVGVGDIETSYFFDPPLSTVGVSHKRLHDDAASLLMKLLSRDPPKPSQLVIRPVVTLRESTGHESISQLQKTE